MARPPTGRRRRRVQPEIQRTFFSIVYNISSDLGNEQLQRKILARRRTVGSNSNDIVLPRRRQRPHGTQIHPLVPTVSASTTATEIPLPQISSIPLARQPLQPLQQIRHRLGTCTIVCSDCNALHWIEERSRKSTRQIPKFSTCCMNGTISLRH